MTRSLTATPPATESQELARLRAERDADLGAERRLLMAEVLIVAAIMALFVIARMATG